MRLVLLIGALALPQAAPTLSRVSGRVTTDPPGSPLAGVRIALYPDPQVGNPRSVAATSNREGRYEIRDVPPGRYRLEPTLPGYVLLSDGPDRASSPVKTIEIRAGQSSLLADFRMHRTSSITVQVSDDLGGPMGDVRVSLEAADDAPLPAPSDSPTSRRVDTAAPPRRLFSRQATTDDAGEARLLDVPPGQYYAVADPHLGSARIRIGSTQRPMALVRAYYPNARLRTEAPRLMIAPAQDMSIGIKLQTSRLWRIRGTVVSSSGVPHARAVVTLFPALSVETVPGAMLAVGTRQVSASADGLFEVPDIFPGEYRIAAASSVSLGVVNSGSTAVSVQDRDVTGIRIVTSTEPSRRGSSSEFSAAVPPPAFVGGGTTPMPQPGEAGIQGRVLAAGSDAPLRRALVSLGTSRTMFSDAVQVLTDEEGRYELAGLSAGPYMIRARKSGFATVTYGTSETHPEPETIQLEAKEQRRDINVRLQTGSAIVVSVIDRNGAPVRSARIQISKKGEAQERITVADSVGRTDERGLLRVGSLPSGTYYVGAIDDSSNSFSMMVYFPGTLLFAEAQPLVLSGGQEASVVVTLTK